MKKIICLIGFCIKKIFVLITNAFIFVVGLFVPKTKKIVIFGSWFGQRYNDNSAALFEQLQSDRRFKKLIWVTKNREVLKELREKGYFAFYTYSLKSVWYHLRAKTHIVDQDSTDINRFFSIRARKLNLYHGIIGLKRVGIFASSKSETRFESKINSICIFTPGCWSNCYYLSTSKFGGEMLSQSFLLKKDHIVLASYPRHYYLLNKQNAADLLSAYQGKKVGLYLPTFRKEDDSESVSKVLSIMNDMCKQNDTYVIFKPHFADKDNVLNNYERIQIIDSEVNIDDLISDVDFVITDYSSVCWDALSIKKPVLFYVYDLDKYLKDDRGLYIDLNKLFSSDIVLKESKEFELSFNKLCSSPEKFYLTHEDEYYKATHYLNEFVNGYTIEPIVQFILK